MKFLMIDGIHGSLNLIESVDELWRWKNIRNLALAWETACRSLRNLSAYLPWLTTLRILNSPVPISTVGFIKTRVEVIKSVEPDTRRTGIRTGFITSGIDRQFTQNIKKVDVYASITATHGETIITKSPKLALIFAIALNREKTVRHLLESVSKFDILNEMTFAEDFHPVSFAKSLKLDHLVGMLAARFPDNWMTNKNDYDTSTNLLANDPIVFLSDTFPGLVCSFPL